MGVLKYPFYIACVLFAVLTVYSVSTEKPRQFKAKPVDEASAANASKPMAELWNTDAAIASALSPTTATTSATANSANKANSSNPPSQKLTDSDKGKSTPPTSAAQSSNNVVVGYSNNDAGGKIVLTLNKCEKGSGTVAYTTAPDGRVDYGCWTFDELYIVINWDKAGVNNYTYDRFQEINTNERLTSKLLFAAQQNQLNTPATSASSATPVTPAKGATPAPAPAAASVSSPSATVNGVMNTTKTSGGKK